MISGLQSVFGARSSVFQAFVAQTKSCPKQPPSARDFEATAKVQKNRAQDELNRTAATGFCRLTAFAGFESLLALAHPLL